MAILCSMVNIWIFCTQCMEWITQFACQCVKKYNLWSTCKDLQSQVNLCSVTISCQYGRFVVCVPYEDLVNLESICGDTVCSQYMDGYYYRLIVGYLVKIWMVVLSMVCVWLLRQYMHGWLSTFLKLDFCRFVDV